MFRGELVHFIKYITGNKTQHFYQTGSHHYTKRLRVFGGKCSDLECLSLEKQKALDSGLAQLKYQKSRNF